MTDDKTCAHCGEPLDSIDSYNVSINHNERLEDDSPVWSGTIVYLCEECWNKVKQFVTNDDLERVVMRKPGDGVESVSTEGWKRCPFCKGEPRAVLMNVHDNVHDTDWTITGGCHECGARFATSAKTRDEAIAKMRRLWDARHERTCHVVYEPGEPDKCSECGNPIYERCHYCSYCGAKRVDE